VDERARHDDDQRKRENEIDWRNYRAVGPEEGKRQQQFIAEPGAKGLFGDTLRAYCERRERETGPHHEPTWIKHDRTQLCPFSRDDPRWWPHTPEERELQRRKMGAMLDKVGIHLDANRDLMKQDTEAAAEARRRHYQNVVAARAPVETEQQ